MPHFNVHIGFYCVYRWISTVRKARIRSHTLCVAVQALFGLAINLYDPRRKNLFATTGSNRATVYEMQADGGIQVRQVMMVLSL